MAGEIEGNNDIALRYDIETGVCSSAEGNPIILSGNRNIILWLHGDPNNRELDAVGLDVNWRYATASAVQVNGVLTANGQHTAILESTLSAHSGRTFALSFTVTGIPESGTAPFDYTLSDVTLTAQ